MRLITHPSRIGTRRLALALAIALVSLNTACTRLGNNTPTPVPTIPGALPPVVNPAGTEAPPGSPGQSGATQPPSGEPLALQVLSPQQGAVVKTPQVVVSGTSTPGAVVTVNDDILEVGADGKFQSTLTLVQGNNVIEIDASDDQGNEQTIELNVIYQP